MLYGTFHPIDIFRLFIATWAAYYSKCINSTHITSSVTYIFVSTPSTNFILLKKINYEK